MNMAILEILRRKSKKYKNKYINAGKSYFFNKLNFFNEINHDAFSLEDEL